MALAQKIHCAAPATAPHYRWRAMAAIWAVATLPMCFLAWLLIPVLIGRTPLAPFSLYWLSLALNAVVLTALSLWLLRKEMGGLDWLAVRRRIGLVTPQSSRPVIRLLPYLIFSA